MLSLSMTRSWILFLLFITTVIPGFAGDKIPFSLSVIPGVEIPLGPQTEGGNDPLNMGGSVAVAGVFGLPFLKKSFTYGLLDISFLPVADGDLLMTFLPGVGVGYRISPTSSFSITPAISAGYGLGVKQGQNNLTGGLAFFRGDLGLGFALSSSFSLEGGVSFKYNEAYYGLGANLAMRISFGEGGRSNLKIEDLNLLPIFPVFYKYYDVNPLGTFSLRNEENGVIQDLKVSFFVEDYMTAPKTCYTSAEMKKQEAIQVPLLALYRNEILGITENTKVSGEIEVSYTFMDEQRSFRKNESVRVYHRNAMIWDDDRKAAAFVSSKDPQILLYAKKIGSEIRDQGAGTRNLEFREALGLLEFMKLYGIKYVVDPSSSYSELSESSLAVDYLQFPVQTFTYSSGDCDDLSICYAALLEALGTETAFVTIPGHIFLAFKLEITPEAVNRYFINTDDLIIQQKGVWVPVEVTSLQDGFLESWRIGAREWRKATANGNAGFWPMHEAWEIYEAVGAEDPAFIIEDTDINKILVAYEMQYEIFVKNETELKIAELRNQMNQANSSEILNRIGTLYARYGLYDKASLEFREALNKGSLSAMINLGNIHFINENFQLAIEYYEQALGRNPRSAAAVAGMARTYYKIGSPVRTKEFYTTLKDINPTLAERLAYLDTSSNDSQGRASNIDSLLESSIQWSE